MALATGRQSMTGKSLGQNVDDTTITTTVKSRLVADRIGNLTSVDIDTNQGVVYLKSNVATPERKADAEGIARSVGDSALFAARWYTPTADFTQS